jgi:hypothetical protein
LSNLFSLSAKVPGMLVQPINPTVTSHIPCNSFFLFDTSTLMAIGSNLHDHIICGHYKAIPHVKASDVSSISTMCHRAHCSTHSS